MDSNHDKQIQNLQCYRYTTRQWGRLAKMPTGGGFFNRKGEAVLVLVAQGGEDGFGGLAVCEVAGVDTDTGGFAVEGFAFAV